MRNQILRSVGFAIGVVFSLCLAACSGGQNGVLPGTVSKDQLEPQMVTVSPCLGGCYNYSGDGNLGFGSIGGNPGPLPNEGGCNPSIETDCGVAAAPKYRSPQERACNDKGGVFITKQDGTTVCSSDQLLNAFIGYEVGCNYAISTYPTMGGGTGIKIVPKPSLMPQLPYTYDSVYGVRINPDCGWNVIFRNPNVG